MPRTYKIDAETGNFSSSPHFPPIPPNEPWWKRFINWLILEKHDV